MGEVCGRSAAEMERIVLCYENMVYRTALAVMGCKADAEDVTQEVFLKAMEKAPVFLSEANEKAWLAKVTMNHARSRLRSPWYTKRETLTESYPTHDPEQQLLLETVFKLPVKHRIAICLHYYQGYSAKEIAELSGQKEATVRSQLFRARRALKAFLEGESHESI